MNQGNFHRSCPKFRHHDHLVDHSWIRLCIYSHFRTIRFRGPPFCSWPSCRRRTDGHCFSLSANLCHGVDHLRRRRSRNSLELSVTHCPQVCCQPSMCRTWGQQSRRPLRLLALLGRSSYSYWILLERMRRLCILLSQYRVVCRSWNYLHTLDIWFGVCLTHAAISSSFGRLCIFQ